MFLPAEIILILGHFAPVFTQPTYQKALVLVIGTILTKGGGRSRVRCVRWAKRKIETGPSIIRC
jgi:hypothetical protein